MSQFSWGVQVNILDRFVSCIRQRLFFYITKVLVMDAKTYSELENPFHNMFYLGNETG